ncbi:tribbles homolog 2-like [Lampetra fluviatilis]
MEETQTRPTEELRRLQEVRPTSLLGKRAHTSCGQTPRHHPEREGLPPALAVKPRGHCPARVGEYLLVAPLDVGGYRAVHEATGKEFICKVVEAARWPTLLEAYRRVCPHELVSSPVELLVGSRRAYALHAHAHSDAHALVRERGRLPEPEAARLFRHMAEAVACCHEQGLVLRDLKLRRFVFRDPERTELVLDGLEDALLLQGTDDSLTDRRACPAYVSPELLRSSPSASAGAPRPVPYSGRAADVWGLGVALYAMLVGRYPFHDPAPSALFRKIRHGRYALPEWLSPAARCLIGGLLRHEPSERATARDALQHPWLRVGDAGSDTDTATNSRTMSANPSVNAGCARARNDDQTVPDVGVEEAGDLFFS